MLAVRLYCVGVCGDGGLYLGGSFGFALAEYGTVFVAADLAVAPAFRTILRHVGSRQWIARLK
jgi:hypothetical protein